jgi:ribosome assembly protein 4
MLAPEGLIVGHKNWVLCVAWSPDAKVIATGSMDNTVDSFMEVV